MNFIKNQIVKIANLVIIAGIGLTAVGLWTMFEERNVSSEPKIMDLASLESQGDDMVYATVNGGTPDMAQVFEYSVKTRKRKTTLLTKYFVPVIDTTDNSVAYILETATNPASWKSHRLVSQVYFKTVLRYPMISHKHITRLIRGRVIRILMSPSNRNP